MKARGHVCLTVWSEVPRRAGSMTSNDSGCGSNRKSEADSLANKFDRLKSEIWKEYGNYTVLDARKAARHCRETMEAYRRLALNTMIWAWMTLMQKRRRCIVHTGECLRATQSCSWLLLLNMHICLLQMFLPQEPRYLPHARLIVTSETELKEKR